MKYQRRLNLKELLSKKSHFLFGPRSTGKTTLIENQLPEARMYDLLDSRTYHRLLQNPALLEEENIKNPSIIVIDEIQKLPILLDEVHRLIKKYDWKFLLTGSSARKLKSPDQNLLGGRAWEAHLYPLTSQEIPDFNLIQYLNRGGLPFVYNSKYPNEELKNYISLYLREEVLKEGIVKKYVYFLNFLDTVGAVNGQEINFEKIASDAQVPARTVLNYFQVLEDTLIGFQLKPFRKTKTRKAATKSKFYFFDTGVARSLGKISEILWGSVSFGAFFEHFIINEIKAYLSYNHKDFTLGYWRSVDKFEVDCLIGEVVAIEIKSTKIVTEKHLAGLLALQEEGIFKKYLCVSLDTAYRETGKNIQIIPWELFLKMLWAGEIV